MTAGVLLERDGDVAVVLINNPPINASDVSTSATLTAKHGEECLWMKSYCGSKFADWSRGLATVGRWSRRPGDWAFVAGCATVATERSRRRWLARLRRLIGSSGGQGGARRCGRCVCGRGSFRLIRPTPNRIVGYPSAHAASPPRLAAAVAGTNPVMCCKDGVRASLPSRTELSGR
jgi:hypothetical protein